MGWHASDTHGLTFTDCRVPGRPPARRAGPRLRQLPRHPRRRPHRHRRARRRRDPGLPRAVASRTPRTATRSAGRSASNQAVAFKCADLAVMAETARALTYKAAWLKDTGRPFKQEAAMAKLYATEAAVTATREATQIFGGYGFMDETPVARYYRDAKILEIGEGTSEIQRLVISRELGPAGLTVAMPSERASDGPSDQPRVAVGDPGERPLVVRRPCRPARQALGCAGRGRSGCSSSSTSCCVVAAGVDRGRARLPQQQVGEIQRVRARRRARRGRGQVAGDAAELPARRRRQRRGPGADDPVAIGRIAGAPLRHDHGAAARPEVGAGLAAVVPPRPVGRHRRHGRQAAASTTADPDGGGRSC